MMCMKQERYSDNIPYECNTCGEEFPLEGYYEPDGEGGTIIVTATRGHTFCPNDKGTYRYFSQPRGLEHIPTHDVNWTGETT